MSRAFIFPGQGSQTVGMGQDLARCFVTARDVFAEVDNALNQNLSRIMFEGPEDKLTLTENAQPALMACSLAVTRVLEKEGSMNFSQCCTLVAGHSLGEYSALTAAEAFSLADTARLLRIRGQAMQQAIPVGQGAMVALLGLDWMAAHKVANDAAQGEICVTANDNAPDQVVLSGAKSAIERAVEIAKTKGARHAVLLPVSAAFHCALMQPAAVAMAEALSQVEIKTPVVPLVANVTAKKASSPDTLRQLLSMQVTSPVRWRESVLAMKEDGINELIELGTGKILTGLVRRIDPELTGKAINTPQDIENFLEELRK